MAFSRYFYDVFPELIKDYFFETRLRINEEIECDSKDGEDCEKAIGILIHEKDKEIYTDNFFWYSWYFVDLLDQVIYSHFKSNFKEWIDQVGGFPIPISEKITESGIRYVKEKPFYILSKVNISFNSKEWRDACSFFILNTNYFLVDKANVSPKDFFNELLKDKFFNSPPNDFESLFDEIINEFRGV